MDIKNPKIQKLGIGLFLGIIIIALWYFNFYDSNSKEINKLENNLENLRKELAETKNRARDIDRIIEERDSLFTKYKLLERLMPPERDESKFLKSLNNSAANNGILVKNIGIKPSREKEFFYEDPYELDLATTYHKLGFFLSEVANFKFTTTASQMDLKTTGRPGQSLNIKLSISTYHLRDSLATPKDPRDKLKK
ncbi:MAG: type 4a pilus biogenesis protein PilO [Candidatus Zixiibacteriota bacterium]